LLTASRDQHLHVNPSNIRRREGTTMAQQDQWRFCRKCNAMFFDGFPGKGRCAADGLGHEAQGFMFTLPHDVPQAANAQSAWRFCHKCNEMFFDGFPSKGHCKGGGGHEAQGFMFVLPHDVHATSTSQAAWRFCDRCNAMFFDGFPGKGACPAGGPHHAQGFNFVLPHIDPDIVNFDSGSITSPLAMGGSAHLVMRRNGDFTFSTHVHDSGFDNIDYALGAVLMASNGIAFTFKKAGHVEGTVAGLPFGTPNRNDDDNKTGHNAMITRNFDAIVSGARFVTRLDGQGQLEHAVKDALGNAAQQLAKTAATEVIALVAA
jgi:hypothetical protein